MRLPKTRSSRSHSSREYYDYLRTCVAVMNLEMGRLSPLQRSDRLLQSMLRTHAEELVVWQAQRIARPMVTVDFPFVSLLKSEPSRNQKIGLPF